MNCHAGLGFGFLLLRHFLRVAAVLPGLPCPNSGGALCPCHPHGRRRGLRRRAVGCGHLVSLSDRERRTLCRARFAGGPARLPARVCTGAVRAPDCPRGARRTLGARLPSVSQGFSKIAPPGRAAPETRLREPPLSTHILHRFLQSQDQIRNKIKKGEFSRNPGDASRKDGVLRCMEGACPVPAAQRLGC